MRGGKERERGGEWDGVGKGRKGREQGERGGAGRGHPLVLAYTALPLI